jgi:hypothetical protein
MTEGRRGLRLALEAGERLRVLGYFQGQELERDEAMQSTVLGLVDDTLAAAPSFSRDAIVRNGLAQLPWSAPPRSGETVRSVDRVSQRRPGSAR